MCLKTKAIVFSLAVGISVAASAAEDHAPRVAPEYFSPQPATFNAYIYCASVQLIPSGSKRLLRGEFKFPPFSAAPNVSAQIISSTGAAPMQVDAITVDELAGPSGSMETIVVVEAKPLFDVPAGGLYYVNVTVTGVPAASSRASSM